VSDEAKEGQRKAGVVCIVPPELAPKLRETLEEHFADDPEVTVVIERRKGERRKKGDRRKKDVGPPKGTEERRKIRNADGRRVGERRAALVPTDAPTGLPRKVRRYLGTTAFCERVEPSTEHVEDLDTARLVIRIQGGDRDAFAGLYSRYFDRVYGYLSVLLNDRHEAEDAAQQVFMQVLEALPRYERRQQPFRAWLFVAVRNLALYQLRKLRRVDATDPGDIDRDREVDAGNGADIAALDWISDQDLLLFVERLPVAQRQVLLLRFMLDLPSSEIAQILERSPEDVRMLQSRALRFLNSRLTAVGRVPRGRQARSRQYLRQAPVLRGRRFALLRR
jgi:RNA polymerase sigma-70 factor (ECF subfamily)